jgi:hypothetical protein
MRVPPFALCAPSLLLAVTLGCPRFSPQETDQPDSTPEDSRTDDTAPQDLGVPVALVSDGEAERYIWLRLDTQELIYEADLRALFPEVCAPPYVCVAFGSEPMVDPETGEDLAVIIAYVTADRDTAPDPALAARLRLTPGGTEIDWQMLQLDWLTNFGDRPDICQQQVPCVAPDADVVGNEIWQNCTLRNAHAVQVVEETETLVTMWVADTGQPPRAVKVQLEKGETCGVVQEVLGEITHEDWGSVSGPNDLDAVDYQGSSGLLLNHLSSTASDVMGASTLWVEGDDGWEKVYQHPSSGYVLGGHNSDLVTARDGRLYHIYAHGNGAGANQDINRWDPQDDHRGTVGLVRVEDGEAVYLLDAVAPDPGFGFLRDADMLADDSVLVMDSGCMNTLFEGCVRDAAIWHLSLDFAGLEAAGTTGAYTEDHSEQRFVNAEPLDELWPHRVTCGMSTPYEVDLTWESLVGPALRQALSNPISSCEEQDQALRARR